MTEASSIYVDERFYNDRMGEQINNSDCSSYPVRVLAMHVGWMIKSEDRLDGRHFLQEILRNEDLGWYNLKSLRMIIEFLYTKIKYNIFKVLLPCQILIQITFVAVALVNEDLRNKYTIDHENGMVYGTEESQREVNIMVALLVFNLIVVLIQSSINFFMFKMMGIKYLTRIWSLLDTGILAISIVIVAQYIASISTVNSQGIFEEKYSSYKQKTMALRISLMLGQMVIFFKMAYFLTLID